MTKTDENKQITTKTERPTMMMPVGAVGLMPRNYGELIEFAKMVAYSGMVPKNYEGNVGAVLVAVQMGSELGLSPMAALRSIAVINGRPSLWGDAMKALVISHPECEDIVEDDLEVIRQARKATCVVKRKNKSPTTVTFSEEDAKEANLWGKSGPWTQYWPRMLKLRARGFALRDAFPDQLSGIRSAEEERDYADGIDMGPADFGPPAPTPGKRSFVNPEDNQPKEQEPAPEPEQEAKEPEPPAPEQPNSSPFAENSAKEAIEMIEGVRPDCSDSIRDHIERAVTDSRKTVAEAARQKLMQIDAYRANQGAIEDGDSQKEVGW